MKTLKKINAERKKADFPPLNFPLFRKVIEKLETAPAAYDQGVFGAEPDDVAPCGTVACVGGWADILSARTTTEREKRMAGEVDLARAGRSLGLRVGHSLFIARPDSEVWGEHGKWWEKAKTDERRAEVMISLLKNIMATGKEPMPEREG